MLHSYKNRHGKYRTKRIITGTKPPKTKRLRKKKGWFKCWDCNIWFNKYKLGASGVLNNGEKICGDCVSDRYKKNLSENT